MIITTANISKKIASIPKAYKADLPIIIKAINSTLYTTDQDVKFVVDQLINNINKTILLSYSPAKKTTQNLKNPTLKKLNALAEKELQDYDFDNTKVKYKIGDKWKKDFDYKGMLISITEITDKTSIADLEKIKDSLEDVNYHDFSRLLSKYILDTKPKKPIVKTKKSASVLEFPVSKIKTDPKRFQNRNQLNESVLKQIIDNYSPEKLDAVVIWLDKDKNYYLLAGHHRLEATKRLKIKTIPARLFTGTEQAAIKYAKVESNSNRSLETPIERAKIYREMRSKNKTKKQIETLAKKTENKNANNILNLSFLKPKGVVEAAYNSLEGADVQNKDLINKIADWIGNARRNNSILTDTHEKEMFDFLMDKKASKRFSSKTEFLHKINSIVSEFTFKPVDVLNLMRYKYETEGEKNYKTELKELNQQVEALIEKRADLNKQARVIELSNVPDKKERLKAYEKSMSKLKTDLAFYSKKIIELTGKKRQYINAGNNQGALFGVKGAKNRAKGIKGVKNSLLDRNKKTTDQRVFFNLLPQHEDLQTFIGKVEVQQTESAVMTLSAPKGSGKTTTVFKMMNAFAESGYKTLFASLEEHPSSYLFEKKVDEYLSIEAQKNISAPSYGVNNINAFFTDIQDADVIFIDSMKKLKQYLKGIDLDNDLRKKFNGKLFVIIFQLTTDGKMRGGSDAEFDGDIITFIKKHLDFTENYLYHEKNRYAIKPIHETHYNIVNEMLLNKNTESKIEKEEDVTELKYTVE